MKVYVLTGEVAYEGGGVYGVFASAEAAKTIATVHIEDDNAEFHERQVEQPHWKGEALIPYAGGSKWRGDDKCWISGDEGAYHWFEVREYEVQE